MNFNLYFRITSKQLHAGKSVGSYRFLFLEQDMQLFMVNEQYSQFLAHYGQLPVGSSIKDPEGHKQSGGEDLTPKQVVQLF